MAKSYKFSTIRGLLTKAEHSDGYFTLPNVKRNKNGKQIKRKGKQKPIVMPQVVPKKKALIPSKEVDRWGKLMGSEKQIQWAGSIRRKILNYVDLLDHVEMDVWKKVQTHLASNYPLASWWISHKDETSLTSLVVKLLRGFDFGLERIIGKEEAKKLIDFYNHQK